MKKRFNRMPWAGGFRRAFLEKGMFRLISSYLSIVPIFKVAMIENVSADRRLESLPGTSLVAQWLDCLPAQGQGLIPGQGT